MWDWTRAAYGRTDKVPLFTFTPSVWPTFCPVPQSPELVTLVGWDLRPWINWNQSKWFPKTNQVIPAFHQMHIRFYSLEHWFPSTSELPGQLIQNINTSKPATGNSNSTGVWWAWGLYSVTRQATWFCSRYLNAQRHRLNSGHVNCMNLCMWSRAKKGILVRTLGWQGLRYRVGRDKNRKRLDRSVLDAHCWEHNQFKGNAEAILSP